MSPFAISAKPGTDIWRKPPGKDIFNAPTYSPPNTKVTAPLKTFRSATVSFTFTPTEQYDQGGVVLSLNPTGSSTAGTGPPQKWVKSGVELLNGTPVLGTVACDTWADWSLAPAGNSGAAAAATAATILLRKEGDENGVSLWVYSIDAQGVQSPLREICWVFAPGMDGWDVTVEAYAARPAKGTAEDLSVVFGSLEVDWAE